MINIDRQTDRQIDNHNKIGLLCAINKTSLLSFCVFVCVWNWFEDNNNDDDDDVGWYMVRRIPKYPIKLKYYIRHSYNQVSTGNTDCKISPTQYCKCSKE